MQKIVPCIWYNTDAEEAAHLYAAAIPGSSVGKITRYGKEGFDVHHMPEGTVLTVDATIGGFSFVLMNGGPEFKPNPSISFHINCRAAGEVDAIWEKLSPQGTVRMELGTYPFSERFGWIEDKYGVSWQIIQAPKPFDHVVTPVLMYTQNNAGHAEEAVNLYTSVFKDGSIKFISRYQKGQEPEKEGTVSYAQFSLEGTEFGAMDSAQPHTFTFSEGVSLIVRCNDQAEVDHYWEKLTAGGGKESYCGWLYDKYGVSWQATPMRLDELIADPDPVKAGKAMNALLKMRKIDIKTIEEAVNA